MDRASFLNKDLPIKEELSGRYRKWSINRTISPIPADAIVPLDESAEVLLLCSRSATHFEPQTHVAELAFAHELAARNRTFAVTDDPSTLFDKSVAWFLPSRFVSPRLWDYSRQVYEFAAGLERQGNRPFCSSHEVAYWENKAYMHRKLDEISAATPNTKILTSENWQAVDFDIEPALIKKEHSAGSSGIHYFSTAAKARTFVMEYRFRPTESLIMQEVVAGATKDLRLTIVGDRMIDLATYWRRKSAEALSKSEWTTTATTYGSVVEHGDIPQSVVPLAAGYLRRLGIRTAGMDLMWVDDDFSREPVVLEFSPYYQPNPPKPERYSAWTYKEYKAKPFIRDGYFSEQHSVFRVIAGELMDQGLY